MIPRWLTGDSYRLERDAGGKPLTLFLIPLKPVPIDLLGSFMEPIFGAGAR